MRPYVLPLCLLPLLTGCGINLTAPNIVQTQTQNGAPIHGSLRGGNTAIASSHIHLLAAGTTGYGSASTSLLTSGTSGTDSIGGYVTTAADGTFSISGDYTCAPGQQLYLLATGGNSQGNPNGPFNESIALMAALSVCPGSGSLSTMHAALNEISTVALAYALAPYAVDAAHIGTSGTPAAVVGMQNAFANIDNLVDPSSGFSLATTPAGNGVAPQATVNTLANILASCVDTDAATSPSCSTLFSLATSDGTPYGARPSNTASAAINIAHHPAANVAQLFALVTADSPYVGSLASAPPDLTLTLAFETNLPTGPNTLAIDAAGEVWFPFSDGLSGLTPAGAPLPYSPYLHPSIDDPQSLAIDTNGDVWLANLNGNSYTKYSTSAGTFTSAAIPGSSAPISIAIDPAGDLWLSNYLGGSVSKLSPSGAVLGTFPSIAEPQQVLADTQGKIWSPNPDNGSLFVMANDGTHSGAVFASALNPAPGSQVAALDNTGTAWILNQDASISALSTANGSTLSGSPFNLGTSDQAISLALDGSGNLWTLTQAPAYPSPAAPTTNVLSGFSRSGAPLLPNHTFPFDTMTSLAVDGSGNLWTSSPHITTIYEIVGAATPVVTPISVGVAHNTLATRP